MLTICRIIRILQRMGSTLERRETHQVYHPTEFGEVCYAFPSCWSRRSNVVLELDREDSIPRRCFEERVGEVSRHIGIAADGVMKVR
jgi:hypothetical protein